MDRMYFKLIEVAHEVASLSNSLAMNANFREDVDAATAPHLMEIYKRVSDVQQLLFRAVCSQMANDPQERDIPISHEVHDSH